MAGSLGSFSVAVFADIGRFTSDMGKAAQSMQTSFARGSAATAGSVSKLTAQMEKEAQRVERTFSNIKGTIGAAFGIAAVTQFTRNLAQTADAYTNVSAKLGLVTSGAKGLAAAQDQVFAISQRTYSSLDSTATLVSRTTRALISNGEEATVALQKSLALTETIQKAFAVSGATGTEASNAIIQLSQGLAAGALRGEEFNSVSEQGSRITQALAKNLGVTTGQLREMAKEGKLTAEVVQNALAAEAGNIADEFAKLPLTISRSFIVLDNAWTKFVGEADQAAGASRMVAEAIAGVGRNLEPIASGAVAIGAVIAANLGSKAVSSMASYAASTLDAAQAQHKLAMEVSASAAKLEAKARAQAADARAMQISAQSTMAAADAEIVLARARENVIRQNALKAKSEIDMARLSMQLSASELRTAEATLALGAARQKLVAANAAAITSERAYQAALTNSAAKSAAAGLASGGLLSTVGKLGSGLMGLAGGPIGVAVLAIGALYLALSNASENAAAFDQRLKDTEKALDDFNRTALAADLAAMFDVETGSSKFTGEIEQLSDEIQTLTRYADSLDAQFAGTKFGYEFANKAREAREEASLLQAQLDRLNEKAAEAGKTFIAAAQEMLGFGRAAQTVEKDTSDWLKETDKTQEKLREQIIEMRDGVRAGEEYRAMQAANVKTVAELTDAQRAEIDESVRLKTELAGLNESRRQGVKDTRAAEKATKASAKAAEEAAEAHEKYAVVLARMEAEGLGPIEKAQAEYQAQLLDIDRQLADGTIPTLEQYYETLALVEQANRRATTEAIAQAAALEKQRAAPQKLIADMQQEITLLGLTTQARNRAIAALRAEEAMRAAIQQSQEASTAAGKPLLDAKEIADQIAAASELGESLSDLDNALSILDSAKSPFERMTEDVRDLQAALDRLPKRGEDGFIEGAAEATTAAIEKLNSRIAIGSVGALRDATDAMAGLFEEGSKGQKKMEQAAAALTVVQAALAAVEGVRAIIKQGTGGDVYSAFGRMAAMAAAVAPLIAAIGAAIPAFGGGGGPSSQSSEVRQEQQGTGTVLGDAQAKSESMLNAMEITANATEQLPGLSRGMLRALQTLESGIGSASGMLARGAGTVEVGRLDNVGGLIGSLPTLGLANMIFGGKQELIDQGIVIMGGALNDMLSSITVGAYNTVQTDGGWFSSDDIDTDFTDITAEFGDQFQMIIASIADTVREGALALGLLPDDIERALAAYRVEEIKISLKDLTAEEQQAELSAVFSSIFDGLAGDVVPFIEQFQQLGEGLGETLVRVATGVQVTQEAMLQLGFSLDELGPEAFAQVSEGLIELVGGIDAFIEGMGAFVNAFASDEHKFEVAQDALTRAFEQAGLTIPATRDAMWELMQSLDATTVEGREQIATLLRLAGVADTYYDMLEQNAQAAAEALQIAAEAEAARAEAAMAYAETVQGINRQLYELSGATEFRQSLAGIQEQYLANVAALQEQARAAGLSAARTQDLSAAMQLQARQVAQLIRELEQSATSQAESLGYTPLGMINSEIAALQEREAEAARSTANLSDSIRDMGRIASDVASAMLGDMGPLEGQAKADYALQALQGGAISLDAALNAGRDVFASGQDFNSFFNRAIGIAQNRPEDTQQNVGQSVSFAMRELLKQQAELQAQADQANQFMQAQDLATTLADLSAARGQDWQEVAESLGIGLAPLLADLGMSEEELTAWIAEQQAAQDELQMWLATNVTADAQYIVDELRAIFERVDDPLTQPPEPTLPDPYDKDPWEGGAKSTREDERETREIATLEEMRLLREDVNRLLSASNQNTGATATGLREMSSQRQIIGAEMEANRDRVVRRRETTP